MSEKLEKVCTGCKRILPNTDEFFNRHGFKKLDGTRSLISKCKKCKSLSVRRTQKRTRPTKIDMIHARISSMRPQGEEAKAMLKELKIYVDGLITMGQIRRQIAIKKGSS